MKHGISEFCDMRNPDEKESVICNKEAKNEHGSKSH